MHEIIFNLILEKELYSGLLYCLLESKMVEYEKSKMSIVIQGV